MYDYQKKRVKIIETETEKLLETLVNNFLEELEEEGSTLVDIKYIGYTTAKQCEHTGREHFHGRMSAMIIYALKIGR